MAALIAILILALLFSVASTIVCGILYNRRFSRSEAPDWNVRPGLNYSVTDEKYPRETVSVPSDGLMLNGYLFGADNTKGLVVFCHGMGGGTEFYLAEICKLVDYGWQVLACDFRGSFTSPGDTIKGVPQSVIDLDNILTWVESQPRFDGMKICLAGHSWGGYAATNVLNKKEHDIAAVAAFAAIYSAFDCINDQMNRMLGHFGKIAAPFGVLYQLLLFGKPATYTAASGINRANIPVMIVHGDRDEVIFGVSAIPSHKDEITNPNVVYVERTGEGIGTHNDLMKSVTALGYAKETERALEQYRAEHGGTLTYEEECAFYDTVDDWRISEVDEELWQQVDRLFTDAIGE